MSTTKRVLVFGWYQNHNVGDNLFEDAFKFLFPHLQLTFVNTITSKDLQEVDAVFIGGGSFLGEPINLGTHQAFDLLKRLPILYLGVGAETVLHPHHQQLMALARLIAIRSPSALAKIKAINPKTMVIPDLVYCLTPSISDSKIPNSVLVLPNIIVVPSWQEPHWKHAAWDYFKTEFAQFLDQLVKDNYSLNFFPLCTNNELNDQLAAAEIVARMRARNSCYFLDKKSDLASITYLMSRYSTIVTQRYHGVVLAQMVGTPCLTISHHDKLKNAQGNNLSYYGITKDKLREQFDQLKKVSTVLPIDRDIFVQLQRAVNDALCGD